MCRQSEPEQATDTRTDTTVKYKNYTRFFAKVHYLAVGNKLMNSKVKFRKKMLQIMDCVEVRDEQCQVCVF